MKCHVRARGGAYVTIEADTLGKAMIQFYEQGRYNTAVRIEGKWTSDNRWLSYTLEKEITITYQGPVL